MNIQARLTLSSVLVMTAIVVIISALDLGYEMDAQFLGTLDHAELLKQMASGMVVETLNHDRVHMWREALNESNLGHSLTSMMSATHAVQEIAVCDKLDKILLDSDPKSVGKKFTPFQPFEPV